MQQYKDPSSVKVLVLGDSGVGKSSLVHMLCHNEPLRTLTPTVGCNIDVRLHTFTVPSTATASAVRSGIPSLITRSTPSPDSFSSSSTPGAEATFVEFYDVSGSPARHSKSRSMFYRGATYQGLILVHDLCNKRSYENLWKWINDFMEESQSASALAAGGYNSRQYGHLDIPLLVVGTKSDMFTGHGQQRSRSSSFGLDLVEKYGGEVISVNAISAAEFAPNSSASIAFNLFFNSVIHPSASAGTGTPFSRTRSSSNQSGYLTGAATPVYSKPSRPPTPGQDPLHQSRPLSNESDPGTPIPIVDFATFTGGVSNTLDVPDDRSHTPSRTGSPSGSSHGPERPITPTGISSSAALSTKSTLRAQYERNRSVLNQYSNVGVPVYTGSRSVSPSGPR
ncbi:MAG: P-loop containing nucleoside triphosphate hydrolase protein [Benniella sp.]|nr:MAG: P-loop containing nucleoside triphosphate hydrolase protein [Benniella sp.]